jgi:hypothetical protein
MFNFINFVNGGNACALCEGKLHGFNELISPPLVGTMLPAEFSPYKFMDAAIYQFRFRENSYSMGTLQACSCHTNSGREGAFDSGALDTFSGLVNPRL